MSLHTCVPTNMCMNTHMHSFVYVCTHTYSYTHRVEGIHIPSLSLKKWNYGNIGFISFWAHHHQDPNRDFPLDGIGLCQFSKFPHNLVVSHTLKPMSVSQFLCTRLLLLYYRKKKKGNQKFPTLVYTKGILKRRGKRGSKWVLVTLGLLPSSWDYLGLSLPPSKVTHSGSPSWFTRLLSFVMLYNRRSCEIPTHLRVEVGHFNDLRINHSIICSFKGKT